MLCKQGRPEEIGRYTTGSWIAEAKFDGIRLVFHNVDGEKIKAYVGRNASPRHGHFPYIEKALLEITEPDTCVDGELLSTKGGGWNDVASIVGRGDPHLEDDIHVVIFDILRVDGRDVRLLPWTERRKLIEALPVDGHPQLDVSPIFPTAATTLDIVIDHGFEGLVMKNKHSSYAAGRSSSWVKFKKQITYEAKVFGYTPGEGMLDGMLGALEIEMLETGAKAKVGTGFNMQQRMEIVRSWEETWNGAIIEIRADGLHSSGKPKCPAFYRLRQDRAAAA